MQVDGLITPGNPSKKKTELESPELELALNEFLKILTLEISEVYQQAKNIYVFVKQMKRRFKKKSYPDKEISKITEVLGRLKWGADNDGS